MASDDDKPLPEQDPWAGLDIDGEAQAGDASPELPEEDIPLVVFPPPVAESDASTDAFDELVDADVPGVISMTDASVAEVSMADVSMADVSMADVSMADVSMADASMADASMADASMTDVAIHESADGVHAAADGHDQDDGSIEPVVEAFGQQTEPDFVADVGAAGDHEGGDGFDDAELARELGLLDAEAEAEADADADADADAGLASDEISASEQSVAATESGFDESSAIPLAVAAAAGASVAAAGVRPTGAKKKGSGLGQLVGVAAGGLMALPITYAILIWGFHKDPFKFGKQVPSQLAFLLPQKLQPGYKPPKKAGPGPNLDAATSLDDLPTAGEVAPDSTVETAAATDEGEPKDSVAAPSEASPKSESAVEPEGSSLAEATVAAPAAEPMTKPALDGGLDTLAVSDAVVAVADMPAASGSPASTPTDALAGLDAIVADAAVTAPVASLPMAAAKPPLDFTAVEGAAERVTQAGDALDTLADPSDPERDRRLVVWYRRLARLGEEMVRLENTASDSGQPLTSTPVAAAEVMDRICVDETRVADLDRLDGMWLTSQSRHSDGATLIAVLGASRRVGPYWSTTATLSRGNADGTDRSVTIISRVAPPADAGNRVLVSGVMFDGDAVWAADIRPVGLEPTTREVEIEAAPDEPGSVGPRAE